MKHLKVIDWAIFSLSLILYLFVHVKHFIIIPLAVLLIYRLFKGTNHWQKILVVLAICLLLLALFTKQLIYIMLGSLITGVVSMLFIIENSQKKSSTMTRFRRLKRGLKFISIGLLATLVLLVANARLIEQRSFSSWTVERVVWLSGIKNNLQKQDEQQFLDYLASKQAISDQPFPRPNVSSTVTESWVDGMQVFTWNDKIDPNQPVLFHIHGGGYLTQPTQFHFMALDQMAQALDAKVIFPIYPKIPRYSYEDAFPKMMSLYQQVIKELANPNQLTLMGDSAGGGFALGLALYARDHHLPQPKDIIMFSPWLDVATDNPEIANYESLDPLLSAWGLHRSGELWANGTDNMQNPYVSPIYGDLTGLGHISIFVGTHEIFFPDNQQFHQRLNQLKIDHNYYVADKMNHFYTLSPLPEGEAVKKATIRIIKTKY